MLANALENAVEIADEIVLAMLLQHQTETIALMVIDFDGCQECVWDYSVAEVWSLNLY